MARTPDRFPGVRKDEGIDLSDNALAAADGEMRYNNAGGRFSFYDSIGEYDPRSGAFPPATAIGNVLFSIDGSNFTEETPLTGTTGWLVNSEGTLIVTG